MVDRGGQLRLFLEPNLKNSSKLSHVGSLVAALKGGSSKSEHKPYLGGSDIIFLAGVRFLMGTRD